jgi:TnpA family transposase
MGAQAAAMVSGVGAGALSGGESWEVRFAMASNKVRRSQEANREEQLHDLAFGLFDLLCLQFSPRPRDLGDQKLYRIDTSIRYQNIGRIVAVPSISG